MATHATVWYGIMSTAAGAIAVGQAVVKNSSDEWVPSTAANRALYGRSRGVAKTPADTTNRTFEIQVAGPLSASVSGIASGSSGDWVIVDANGNLLRDATPDAGEDVIGRCPHTSAEVQIAPGVWDETNTLGGGGAGTPGGSDGDIQYNDNGTLEGVPGVTIPVVGGGLEFANGYFLWSPDSFGGLHASLIGLDTDDVIRIGSTIDFGYPGLDVEIDVGASQAVRLKAQELSLCGNVVQIGRYAGGTPDGGGGIGVVGLDDCSTPPSNDPTGGIIFYSESGTLKYRQPDGSIIVLDGTGDPLPTPGAAGNVLTSDGADWVSSTPATLNGVCTLEQFGAVGDGVTNDQAAFEAARAALAAGTYGALILDAKTYVVEGTADPVAAPWPRGIAIMGAGPQSVLLTTTNAKVLAFSDTDANDRQKGTLVSDFKVLGNDGGINQWAICNGLNGGDGSGSGFMCRNVEVEDCAVAFFSAYGPTNGDGATFVGCKAKSCTYGFYPIWQTKFTNCQATGCTYSWKVATGNVTFANCDVTGSVTKTIEVDASGNDGHGIFIGCNLNHNAGAPIDIAAIANGHTFVGCHIYETPITVAANTGLTKFVGCTLDVTAYTFTSSLVKFSDCVIDQAYFASYNESGTPDVEWLNCREMDGTVPAFIRDRVQVAFTFAGDANDTLTKQESRARVIDIQSGVISAGRDLTSAHAPAGAKSREIVIRNGETQAVTFKWSTGTGVSVAAGTAARIGSDGTNAVLLA